MNTWEGRFHGGQRQKVDSPSAYRGIHLLVALIGVWADPLRAFGEAVQGGRDIVVFEFGSRRVYLVNGPKLAQQVLRQNKAFVKPRLGSRFRLWFGREGLVGSAAFRSMALAAFERRRIEQLLSTMDEVVSSCFARFDYHANTQKPFNLSSEAMRLSLIVSGRALFNVDMRREAKQIIASLDTVQSYYAMQPTRVALGLVDFLPGYGAAAARSAVATLHDSVDRIIATGLGAADRSQDLLGELLQACHRDDISPNMLRNVVMAALLSSYETTGCALAWSLMCLANNPDHAERIAAEAASLPNGRLTARDLSPLEHTRKVFRESMRLYPPSWVIVREIQQPQALDGYCLRERSTVLLSPYWIHRHPDYWQKPEVFDPERFQGSLADGHSDAYVPFGAGPHACFGARFATFVAQLALARLVGRYHLRLTSTWPFQPRALISLQPPESVNVVLTARHNNLNGVSES